MISLTAVAAFTQTNSNSQLSKIQQWQLLDFKQDSVYGMSENKAYNELLKGKQSHTVIVAVIANGTFLRNLLYNKSALVENMVGLRFICTAIWQRCLAIHNVSFS